MRSARGVFATPREDSGSDYAERSDAEEDAEDPDYQQPEAEAEAEADDEGDLDSEQSENEYEEQQQVDNTIVKKPIRSVSNSGMVVKQEATAAAEALDEAREATRPEQPEVKSPKDVHEEQEPRNSKSVIAMLGNVTSINEKSMLTLDKLLLPASLNDIPQMKSWIRQLAQSGWWDLHRILTLYRGEVPCDEKVFAIAHHASKHMRLLRSTSKKAPTSDLFEVLLTP